jgi:hypothetical protein
MLPGGKVQPLEHCPRMESRIRCKVYVRFGGGGHAIPIGSTVPTLLSVELVGGLEVFGQQGTGVAHRGELLQSGIKFAY